MINSSSVRLVGCFSVHSFDCLALMMIIFIVVLYLVWAVFGFYISTIWILLVIRSFVVGFVICGSCSFVGGFLLLKTYAFLFFHYAVVVVALI